MDECEFVDQMPAYAQFPGDEEEPYQEARHLAFHVRQAGMEEYADAIEKISERVRALALDGGTVGEWAREGLELAVVSTLNMDPVTPMVWTALDAETSERLGLVPAGGRYVPGDSE